MDAPTAPTTHTPGRRQGLVAVAKDFGPREPHAGQPVHGHTKHVELLRAVRFRHTGRFRSEALAAGGNDKLAYDFRLLCRYVGTVVAFAAMSREIIVRDEKNKTQRQTSVPVEFPPRVLFFLFFARSFKLILSSRSEFVRSAGDEFLKGSGRFKRKKLLLIFYISFTHLKHRR